MSREAFGSTMYSHPLFEKVYWEHLEYEWFPPSTEREVKSYISNNIDDIAKEYGYTVQEVQEIIDNSKTNF